MKEVEGFNFKLVLVNLVELVVLAIISYVIARRGLKFKDYLLKQQKLLLDKTILTKYHWTQWFHFNKLVTN